MKELKTLIISRTDGIGDVVLTLPLAHVLKERFPQCRIVFLGKSYTKPALTCCSTIDEIICWDEIAQWDKKRRMDFFRSLGADCIIHVFPDKQIAALARRIGIPLRVGTSHRLYHWFTCNKLPGFTRKNSNLHEAQLNFKLLKPLGIAGDYSLETIRNYFDFTKIKPLAPALAARIDPDRYNLILHPKSKGSAREWGIANFSGLVKILPKDKFKIFVTGTRKEGEGIKNIFSENAGVADITDLTGMLSLSELISFINHCDALVAASTGPLHLAAVLEKKTVGIYPPMRPIHPGRWSPLGRKAAFLVSTEYCTDCRNGKECNCMYSVKPEEVAQVLMRDLK